MNSNAKLLAKFKKLPMGLWLFSRAICFKAPYFSTISPTFTKLDYCESEAYLRKRRSVQNHIGTVHAIAVANLCEFVAGTTLEVSLASTHRWIPKSMKINYIAKAETDIIAKTKFDLSTLPDAGSIIVPVQAFDLTGKLVTSADIEMYISKKKT